MSLPPNPSPDPFESTPPQLQDSPVLESVPVVAAPLEKPFPAWKFRDVVAILVFTLVAILVFTVGALFVAHSLPQYRNAPFTELATNAIIVIGAQTAAYPLVLLFIFVLVRSRSRQSFGRAIQWQWPGTLSVVFVIGGVVLALVVESLARYLPIPKSLPMDTYFKDPTSAYLMASFGITLAPLLEELFFRGLLYPLLGRAFGVVTGVVLTAAAFAAIHGAQLGYAWAPVLSIFVVGVAFTVVRVRTSSVAASFLMHCGYNLALFSALWIGSDHFRHLEKVTN
ncbi:MAG TPA: CPBP family intramembrane glutamic endopeptidase [Terriglobales bacterium]|nr:CPBP family intramembrane glutamic endopeptidase [Terriglobales bacterium]